MLLLFSHAPLGVRCAKRQQSMQSCQFWAISIISFRERFFDFSSWCIILNHIIQACPSGLLLSSGAEAVNILLASALCGQHAVCPNGERCRDWTMAEKCLRLLGCLSHFIMCTCWKHMVPSSMRRHHRSRASSLIWTLSTRGDNYDSIRAWYDTMTIPILVEIQQLDTKETVQTRAESLQQPLKSAAMTASTCRDFASFAHMAPSNSGKSTCQQCPNTHTRHTVLPSNQNERHH